MFRPKPPGPLTTPRPQELERSPVGVTIQCYAGVVIRLRPIFSCGSRTGPRVHNIYYFDFGPILPACRSDAWRVTQCALAIRRSAARSYQNALLLRAHGCVGTFLNFLLLLLLLCYFFFYKKFLDEHVRRKRVDCGRSARPISRNVIRFPIFRTRFHRHASKGTYANNTPIHTY